VKRVKESLISCTFDLLT